MTAMQTPDREPEQRTGDAGDALRPALEQTLDWALQEIGAPWGAIALRPEAWALGSPGYLLLAERRPPPEGCRTRREPWPDRQATLDRVMQSADPHLVDDLALDPEAAALAPGARSQIAAPILLDGRPAGVLALEAPERAAFDAAHLRALERLAGHAALAVRSARLESTIEQLRQTRWEFVDVAAHELKQPLTSVQGYARMLSLGIGGALSEGQQQFVDVIAASTERMSNLLNDLLEVARLEAGRIELHLEPLEPSGLVEDAVTPLRAAIEAKAQSLEVDLAADLPPIRGDGERLCRALANVVRNAHQYTPEGGQIRIHGRRQAGWVRIAVQDTGIGIALDDQARVFDAFFRAADPAVQDQRGNGMGLYVALKLAQVHGGELRVESAVGKGSTFTLVLPAG